MKPILFNTEMVKAILEGRKTCTRRLVKPAALLGLREECRARLEGYTDEEIVNYSGRPYYPGDVLYVRETWFEYAGRYVYKATAAQPELWNAKCLGIGRAVANRRVQDLQCELIQAKAAIRAWKEVALELRGGGFLNAGLKSAA